MSYQGWSNYQTWCVNLWLGNEEPLYREWMRTARQVVESSDDKDDAVHELSARMRVDVCEAAPELQGLWADLLTSALDDVSFHEIAEAWVDTALENGAEFRETETEVDE